MTALSPPHRHSVGWLVGLGRAYNKIEEKQNESPKHQYTHTKTVKNLHSLAFTPKQGTFTLCDKALQSAALVGQGGVMEMSWEKKCCQEKKTQNRKTLPLPVPHRIGVNC